VEAVSGPSRPPAAVSRPRRARSTTESLLSIVLGLEAILMFFVTLTAFGLKAVPPVTAFVGGGVLIVLLVLVAGLLRYRWGVWLGWVLQAVLVATGILLPIMFLVAAAFVAIWVYCFIKGRQIDALRRLSPSKSNQQES
jgi:hypothetical protein